MRPHPSAGRGRRDGARAARRACKRRRRCGCRRCARDGAGRVRRVAGPHGQVGFVVRFEAGQAGHARDSARRRRPTPTPTPTPMEPRQGAGRRAVKSAVSSASDARNSGASERRIERAGRCVERIGRGQGGGAAHFKEVGRLRSQVGCDVCGRGEHLFESLHLGGLAPAQHDRGEQLRWASLKVHEGHSFGRGRCGVPARDGARSRWNERACGRTGRAAHPGHPESHR